MAVKNKDLMTPYEKRMYDGIEKTAADLCKDNEMLVQSAARQILAVKIEAKLDTGEEINVPVVSLLLMKKFRYWLENPKEMDIKALSAITDNVKKDESAGSFAADFFKGIVPVGKGKKNGDTK